MRNRITNYLVDKPKKREFIKLDITDDVMGLVIKYKKIILCDREVYETRLELYTLDEVRSKKIDYLLK